MDKYTAQEKAFQKKLFISGTNIPKNKANIKDKESLKDFEEIHFSIKSLNPPEGDFSSNHLKKIHKHLLEDVYDWAGEYRNFPIARGESAFCRPEYIKQETDKITKAIVKKRLKALKESYANLSIENMNIKPSSKKFLEDMVKKGLTQEQMTEQANLRFKNG